MEKKKKNQNEVTKLNERKKNRDFAGKFMILRINWPRRKICFCEGVFKGYRQEESPQPHPCYRSTSMDYGYYSPTIHTVPTAYYARSTKFSSEIARGGMYRNRSLNTELDKTLFWCLNTKPLCNPENCFANLQERKNARLKININVARLREIF